MAKVKVSDIFTTRKNLVRFNNYARNHMDNLPIAEMNDRVAEARALLADNVDAFDDMDVTELTPDTTDLEKNLNHMYESRDEAIRRRKEYKKQGKKDVKRDPDDTWYLEQAEYLKANIREYNVDIEHLESLLNE